MSEISTVGPDLAKPVFQIHRAEGEGRPVPCKTSRRDLVPSSENP